MSTPSLSRVHDLLRDLRLEIRRIEVVETETGVPTDDDSWTPSAIEVRQINFADRLHSDFGFLRSIPITPHRVADRFTRSLALTPFLTSLRNIPELHQQLHLALDCQHPMLPLVLVRIYVIRTW